MGHSVAGVCLEEPAVLTAFPSLLHPQDPPQQRDRILFVTAELSDFVKVGGLGDFPVPGDILCAALATCTDSTIRLVANRLGIEILELAVEVEADVDVRGALCVTQGVDVAFQHVQVRVRIGTREGTDRRRMDVLLKTAEERCVVMQTLRRGTPVEIEVQRVEIP